VCSGPSTVRGREGLQHGPSIDANSRAVVQFASGSSMSERERVILNPTLQLSALVDISRRGKGRRRVEFTDARALRFLLAAVTGGRRPRLDGALARHLLHDGILIRPAEVPRDVHLDPRLGGAVSPSRDVPHRGRVASKRGGPGARAPAMVGEAGAPRLRAGSRLRRGPSLPPDIGRRVPTAEPFLPAENILWVRHAGSGIELPYTLTPDVARLARELPRGGRGARPLQTLLRAVGALGGAGDVARERAAWRRQVREWRRELRTSGYAVLRGLFPPIFIAAVREYYRRLEREGYLMRGDARRRGRPLIHGEPLLDFLGSQLTAVVSQITRQRAASTFSFLRVYDGGAVLERHRDRPVCRWNIDLVVGGGPPPVRRTAWPLWIAARPGRRAVRLGLGDGVLYRGTQVTHWRSGQPAGHSTMLACFHYGRPGPLR
jgi:hypothetical protein